MRCGWCITCSRRGARSRRLLRLAARAPQGCPRHAPRHAARRPAVRPRGSAFGGQGAATERTREARAARPRGLAALGRGSAGGPRALIWRRLGGNRRSPFGPAASTMRRAATLLLTLCGAAAFVGRPSTTKTPVALRSTAETAAPTKRVITITPDALTHIKKLREDNGPDTHLRMGVRAGGRVRRRPRARARGAPAAVDRSSTGSERARRSRPRRAAGRADTTSLPPP